MPCFHIDIGGWRLWCCMIYNTMYYIVILYYVSNNISLSFHITAYHLDFIIKKELSRFINQISSVVLYCLFHYISAPGSFNWFSLNVMQVYLFEASLSRWYRVSFQILGDNITGFWRHDMTHSRCSVSGLVTIILDISKIY